MAFLQKWLEIDGKGCENPTQDVFVGTE